MACAADGLKFSFHLDYSNFNSHMWLVATVSDSAGLGNFSQLCQKWFRAAFQKVLRNRGAFAALPKQGSTENLEDKLPAFSLGSETTYSSNVLSWSFQHSPTSRSPDFLLSYIVRTIKSEQTNPGTTALDSGRVSTSRELFKMHIPGPRLYWV